MSTYTPRRAGALQNEEATLQSMWLEIDAIVDEYRFAQPDPWAVTSATVTLPSPLPARFVKRFELYGTKVLEYNSAVVSPDGKTFALDWAKPEGPSLPQPPPPPPPKPVTPTTVVIPTKAKPTADTAADRKQRGAATRSQPKCSYAGCTAPAVHNLTVCSLLPSCLELTMHRGLRQKS
jgi:hypothetical protein